MKNNNIYAIVGPTASGKSDLAIRLAKELKSVVLSVDSLSVYKEIDIASAKPTKEEMGDILHFGIDELYPNMKFDVVKFIEIFQKAKEYAKINEKSLIIVGGTSFYLKVLQDGISSMPKISKHKQDRVESMLIDIKKAYSFLESIDREYASKIASNDRYRVQKALEVYFATNITPSCYFRQNRPEAIVKDLPIYEIAIDREVLRKKIELRSNKMLKMGLIDEVAYLEAKYGRTAQSMGAIGIKETLDFLDGRLSKNQLKSKIITNTARLAKRQVTFNKSQLNIAFRGSVEDIYSYIIG
jgi:tRNA dimethylallyltransferase